MQKILIAGCGFTGEAAAFLFKSSNWAVAALCHSEQSAELLRQKGIDAVACDISNASAVNQLKQRHGDISTWIHCASSGRGGADVYRSVYYEGVANLIHTFPDALGVFTSSTSVYAQTDSSWVTEESPTEPPRETGQILLSAERLVLEHQGIVARLAGIYGPGRSVLLQKLLAGEARIEGDGKRWINQIHRDDAAAALHFLITSHATPGIYNVVDDTPTQQETFYRNLSTQLNLPLPPHAEPNLNRKRGWTNKRVSNAKLKALGWKPIHPSFEP